MYDRLTPIQRIQDADCRFGGRLILTTSGGETSAVMPHLVSRALDRRIPLLFVDHGYYTSSTYRMIVYFQESGYDLLIYRSTVTPGEIERDFRGWCDRSSEDFSTVVRKIKHEPLNRAFREIAPQGWLRGIMRHQSLERASIEFLREKNGVWQVHPILDWSREQILHYVRAHELPINEDHWDPTKGRDQKGECLIGERCGLLE